MKIQNKGAVLVQIAPLFTSQPHNQNQSTDQGVGRIFFPDTDAKPPGCHRGPTHPPHTKRPYFQFWRQNSNIWRKIQIFDPKFKFLNFYTTKNLPLSMMKTPGAACLTPTHSPVVVSKKLKRPPFGID